MAPVALMMSGPQDSTLLLGLRPSPDSPGPRPTRWIDATPGRGWTATALKPTPARHPDTAPDAERSPTGATWDEQ